MNVYEKLLIEFFGVTQDISEAGYILQDGTLIDFSGRHFISDPTVRKYTISDNGIQHHDIFGTNYRGFSLEELWQGAHQNSFQPVMSILKECRAVSIKMDTALHIRECWLRMMYPPTEEQYQVIFKNFEEGYANVSYISIDGFIVDDACIKFLTQRKLRDFVASCINKHPTNIPFSTAYSLGRDVSCSPIAENYIPMFDLSNSRELKLRHEMYRESKKG